MHLIYLQYPDLAYSISLVLPNAPCPNSALYMNHIWIGELWVGAWDTPFDLWLHSPLWSNSWVKKKGSECCSVTLASCGAGWSLKVSVCVCVLNQKWRYNGSYRMTDLVSRSNKGDSSLCRFITAFLSEKRDGGWKGSSLSRISYASFESPSLSLFNFMALRVLYCLYPLSSSFFKISFLFV